MKYTTAGELLQKNKTQKDQRFKELLAKSKGDGYYFDATTGTHKPKGDK